MIGERYEIKIYEIQLGDYEFYCARPTSTNDLHGVGAFLLMCGEVERVHRDSAS